MRIMYEIMEDLILKFLEHDNRCIGIKQEGYDFNHHRLDPQIPKSPIFFSIRNIVRDPELRKRLAELMAPCVEVLKAHVLVDLPQAISPLVTTLSDITGIPMISIRSELLKGGDVKDLKGKSAIEGKFTHKEYALIIDDVISASAYTKHLAIEILLDAGLQIANNGIMVVVDREEGGSGSLYDKYGYSCYSLYNLEQILLVFLDGGNISNDQFQDWKEKRMQIVRHVRKK